MKILCTNNYYYRYDAKQWEFAQPYPPLGTLYAVSSVQELGYEVTFFDNNLVESHTEIFTKIESVTPDILVIYDDGFNYLTKMCLTKMKNAGFDIIRFAKAKGITTVFNSSDSTDHFEEYHAQGVDYIIHGEGEETLKALCTAIANNTPISEISGISYVDHGTVVKTNKRSVSRQLDSIPMPAWQEVDIEAYRTIWMEKHGFFSLNLATTRGCPYKCNWCAKPIYGNRYNSRSPHHVIEEIQYLISSYNVDYFWMCDDIFGLKPNWVQQFRDEKKRLGLDFKYKIQSRADLMLQDDNLDALAESGVDEIWLGAESGSQRILDAMDKGTTTHQIYEATRNLKARGVKVAFFLQFGYLTETWSEVKQTIDMVLDLMPDDIGISVSYPLPGTKFYDKVKADLVMKTNWTDSDDLDLMFKNTYPPVFYKILHRYVHNRYRIKKGWLRLQEQSTPKEDSLLKEVTRMIYHMPQAIVNRLLLSKYMKAAR